MQASKIVGTVATAGILGLGGLGLYGMTSENSTEQELSTATAIARIVSQTALSAKSDQAKDSQLLELAEEQLKQLPTSATKLAAQEEAKTSDSATTSTEELKTSAQELYRLAVEHPEATERGQALEFSQEYWNLYKDLTSSDEKVPDWLDSGSSASCTSRENKPQAPESLKALMDSAYTYLYTAQVFDARADIENWDTEVTGSFLADAESAVQRLSQASSCSWQLPTQAASYAIADTDSPQSSLENLRSNLDHNVEVVLADTEIATDSELFKQLAEIFYTQKIS